MKDKLTLNYMPLTIEDDVLIIGSHLSKWRVSRASAPQMIEFIQQWLDHDPEQELIDQLKDIAHAYSTSEEGRWLDMIAAVREHDAKYGKQ